MINRRDFLKLSTAAGVSSCFYTSLASATEVNYEGPYLAIFNASGGWDTTYLMDPKGTPDLNHLYTHDEIRQVGQIRYAPTEGRIQQQAMTNQTFFDRYGSELLVINGIDVSVNNHSPCSRYVATGELDSLKYPTLPALLAAAKSPDAPLSFLTFGQYSGTGNLIAQTRIPYLNSLQRLANSDFTNASRARRYHHESVSAHIDAALTSVHSESHPLPKRARARSFISDAQISSKNIDRIVSHIPQSVPSNRLQQQCEIALAGFSSGLSVSANLKLGTFDSHNTNDVDQMELIPEFLAGVDYMMRRAEEIGIRDQLIVIIQSEMGRTPWYNQTGGKDHWSVTSMMAMGAGITGNRVIGSTGTNPETGFEQYPAQINPTTLAIDPEGIRIRPQHIQQALRTFTGINDHPFATRFALDLPEHEYLVRLFEG